MSPPRITARTAVEDGSEPGSGPPAPAAALPCLWLPAAVLLLYWALAVAAVNPAGEFMVNDDWSYVKSFEALRRDGVLAATGWGPAGAPGGPSLIVHLLWGLIFTWAAGFSLTTLRWSVLVMGVAGSLGLLILLRLTGASRRLALWATLALVCNPLFFSQCFTFMTDITFTALVVFSILALHLGVERQRTAWVAAGLLLVLAATLTRQMGIVLALVFLVLCFVHPRGRAFGPWKAAALAAALTVLPWAAYELYLYHVGSTPITRHQMVHRIFENPLNKGLSDYLGFLCNQVAAILGYLGFLLSPLLVLRWREVCGRRGFKFFFLAAGAALALLTAAVASGWVAPPVRLPGNVIYDFGIGPVLLKDTYILGIRRTATLPPWLFTIVVAWAALMGAALVILAAKTVRSLARSGPASAEPPLSFTAALALATAAATLAVICLAGFHDRYLIPICALLLVWLVAAMPAGASEPRGAAKSNETAVPAASTVTALPLGPLVAALVPLLFMATLSVAGVRDFMEMKRSQALAHHHLIAELHVDPCHVDGGFEFNGYHCYRNDFWTLRALSWWWVRAEDYLVTLGPLPGYRVVRVFPFDRWLGPAGAVHILQPAPGSDSRN